MSKKDREAAKSNGSVATFEDFRKSREFEPTEMVLLPKLGKNVKLRRPTPLWFMLHDNVPVSLSRPRGEDGTNAPPLSFGDVKTSAQWLKEVLQATMVEPRCTEELLDLIDIEDALFISRWAHGEFVSGEGTETKSLSSFRRERELPSGGPHG